ncbi:MAG: hypothetical protein KJO21_04120 [Verrucomicrobiae bacterium]|nr:hypothetical protein [Verrucomicrobiae bacterium]NNJ42685.1 hypothetical protein [Akkermansiaceae bacterium]
MRRLLLFALTASIVLVYGGGSVVAVEVEHSHEHEHAIDAEVNHHGHHHHEPVNSSTDDQDEKEGDEEKDSHSHVVFMGVGAFPVVYGSICPSFERWVGQCPVPIEEGCPDGPYFSLMKPPQ